MSIDKIRRQEIDSLAEQTHKYVFNKSTDYANLEHFLELRGVDVRYVNSKQINGYLRWDDEISCPVIAVSVTDEAPVRHRFTIAHELGHLILDWKWSLNGLYNQKEGSKLESINQEFLDVFLPQHGLATFKNQSNNAMKQSLREEEANEFATAFLIPNSKLKIIINDIVKNDQNGEDLVNYTAWKFYTSTMTSRLRILNYLKYLY